MTTSILFFMGAVIAFALGGAVYLLRAINATMTTYLSTLDESE